MSRHQGLHRGLFGALAALLAPPGQSGSHRSTSYLCAATTGHDGPTGLAMLKGAGGF